MRKENFSLVWILGCLLLLVFGGQSPAAAQYSEEPEEPVYSEPGPRRGVDETVVVPRERPRAPREAQPQENPLGSDEPFHIRTEVELVEVSVVVRNDKGLFVPGLQKQHFQVLEDGVPQQIQRLETSEAAMTVAMVIEFSDLFWEFLYDTLQMSYGFVNSLRPEDYVAIMIYDMKPQILLDFTRNKAAAFNALNQMRIPGFSETNLFDALADILSRMEQVEGKKAVLLIASGVDTFSRTRYDKALEMAKASSTPIYAIGTGQAARLWYEGRGYMSSSSRLDFLQADNQLRSFARFSGGRAYFPRFQGQFPEIYADISASLRNEYRLSYQPTNTVRDGEFREIEVKLVGPDGQRLKIVDEKGEELDYKIQHREGYYAPRPVE